MFKIERILVTSDLSPRADYALARALQLVQQHGAELYALHVVEPMQPAAVDDWLWPAGGMPAGLERDLCRDAERELAARMAELSPAGPAPPAVRTRIGVPFLEIIRQARADNVDLIVLGAHGRAFVRDFLIGTTAERVVRKGDRPVLVVKQPSEDMYRKVLVPVDFSPASGEAVALAACVAPKARLQLMHAYEVWFEGRLRTAGMTSEEITALHQHYEHSARTQLRRFAAEHGLESRDIRYLVRHGYPGRAIARAAEDERSDLAVLGTRGLTGLRYVLLGSVAEHVLREAPCDVLAVHPKDMEFELP